MKIKTQVSVLWPMMAVVMGVAIGMNCAVVAMLGLNKPMESDSYYFLCIAKSLATGQGYMLKEGFWPDVPTMSRAPGWPFVISLVLRLIRGVSPDLLMRLLACCLNVVAAVLVAMLARRVIGYSFVIGKDKARVCLGLSSVNNEQSITNIFSAIAGIVYAAYPVALYEAYEGTSEILFIVLALTGTLLIISKKGLVPLAPAAQGCSASRIGLDDKGEERAPAAQGWPTGEEKTPAAQGWPTYFGRCHWRLWVGVFVMGLSVLVRPNFITWIGFVGLFVIGYWIHQSKVYGLRSMVLCVILFIIPPTLWAVRNYQVCGKFPVLSTLRGAVFYGGNNSVVADSLEWWGYWVFPNSIPGEPTMYSMSRTMSEQDVDVYYFDKGKVWIKTHLAQMPRLILGKLVRAYVPVPWKLTGKSAVVALFRLVLYGAGLVGIVLLWRCMSPVLKCVLAAMLLSNVLTVVMFWGCARFAFELDPFLIPFAVVAMLGGGVQRDFRP